MSRRSTLVLVALGAALVGFALASNARRTTDDALPRAATAAAGPQSAVLGWKETYGAPREHLVFAVESLRVRKSGWTVDLSVANRTREEYEIASTIERPFGLMIFATGDLNEVVRMSEENALPAVRPATRYEPRLPATLAPGDAWVGRISAPGSLVANAWVRVVFGTLVPEDDPDDPVSWISDHAYQLKR